jgi:hypothetical protein
MKRMWVASVLASCSLWIGLVGCGDDLDAPGERVAQNESGALIVKAEPAGPTVIDFENLAATTCVNTQYSGLGVVFTGAPCIALSTGAHSPSRVLRSTDPGVEFDTGPLRIDFTSPQTRVKLYAGRQDNPLSGTLRAYNAAGTQILQDGPRPVAGGALTTTFEVTAASPSITRVTLDYDAGAAVKFIDDLEFEGQAAAPLPTTPPLVRILSPVPGQSFDLPPSSQVEGQAQGDGIVSGRVDVTWPRPTGSQAPGTMSFTLDLRGSGSSRSFRQPVWLPVGDVGVTARVTNSAGLVGSHAIVVSNLPTALRDRVAAEGGSASVGEFAFGGGQTAECAYAVYSQAAVAAVNGTSFVVRGAFLAKWLALTDDSGYPRLGCPVTEALPVTGGMVQRFEHGRIISSSMGVYFLSAEFGEIFDGLGGVSALGLPLADPTSNLATTTWQLQRFRKAGEQVLMANTLEIRGMPAKLLVERQGGDGSLYRGAEPSSTVAMNERTPTLVDTFSCSSFKGPCPIIWPPHGLPIPAPQDYCDGRTFGAADLDTYVHYGWAPLPEWVPIHGQYVQTPLAGIVSETDPSGIDNPWGHENYDDPCWSLNPLDIISGLFSEIEDQELCASDLGVHIRPLLPYKGLMVNRIDNVKIEVEKAFLNQYFLGGYSNPSVGDLVYTSGRLIVDCGHRDPNWKTEIHPPSVLAVMSTRDYQKRPATFADIWVNGFYSGDTVEFDIYPPPRPSAAATLAFAMPADTVGVDVSVVGSISERTHVHVRVNASTRNVLVNPLGEMMMQSGRNYQGQWRVYWDDAPYVGDLVLLSRAADGSIWNRLLDASGWSDWSSLGGDMTSAPAATVDQDGRIRVFARYGTDRAVWQKVHHRDVWNDWVRVGGSVSSAPAAAVTIEGIVWLFARGGNNAIQFTRYMNASWASTWTTLPGTTTSAPAAVVTPQDGRLWIFARGTANDILVNSHLGSIGSPDDWSGWTSLGGNVVSAPAAAVGVDGRLRIFARRLDGTIWTRSLTNGTWSGWSSLGGATSGDPAAATDAAGRVYVVARGAGDSPWYRTLEGSQWLPWTSGEGGHAGGGVAAVFR